MPNRLCLLVLEQRGRRRGERGAGARTRRAAVTARCSRVTTGWRRGCATRLGRSRNAARSGSTMPMATRGCGPSGRRLAARRGETARAAAERAMQACSSSTGHARATAAAEPGVVETWRRTTRDESSTEERSRASRAPALLSLSRSTACSTYVDWHDAELHRGPGQITAPGTKLREGVKTTSETRRRYLGRGVTSDGRGSSKRHE